MNLRAIAVLILSSLTIRAELRAHPFAYDLHMVNDGNHRTHVIICLHGFGGDYKIGTAVAVASKTKARVVSFNFPDHAISKDESAPESTAFGTIDELLPALYVIKQMMDQGMQRIDLYGFSAGGAALVNLLAIVNSNRYKNEMARIGFTQSYRKRFLEILQCSVVLLDAPLKSIEEIMAIRAKDAFPLSSFASRYARNDLRPIDSLRLLKDMKLNVILYFETPDAILGNRDDRIYIQRLKDANVSGRTIVLTGSNGGHNALHEPLWQAYREFKL